MLLYFVRCCYSDEVKDFDNWNKLKKRIEARADADKVYFREREVWWARFACAGV